MRILGTVASSSREVPNAPTIGTATDVGTGRAYNNGRADVTFTAPTFNGGLPITSYTVKVYNSAGVYQGNATTAASSPITITGLSSSVAYKYTVYATNSVGNSAESAFSNLVTATTVPQAPTMGTATCATGQAYTGSANISVPFTAGATGGSAITSYTITSSGGGTASGATSPISISRTVGTSYTFTVTATNANGTSTASAASNSVLSASVPQAPTIGAATAGSGSATVAYTANATGGSAVTTFTATSTPGTLTGTGASPITVSGLTNGTAYTFKVKATNAYGTSLESSASNSVTPVVPLSVTGGTLTSDATYYYRTFTANGTLAVTGGTLVADYLVIGGGGAGGGSVLTASNARSGGGGGAGGVVYLTSQSLNTSYAVTIGAGGTPSTTNTIGQKGVNTSAFGQVGGGGGGGAYGGTNNYGDGGSSGGGAGTYNANLDAYVHSVSLPVSGTGAGNLGGSGYSGTATPAGGGGGGVGGVGGAVNNNFGGAGGAGGTYFGVAYAGGGGGGAGSSSTASASGGSGGGGFGGGSSGQGAAGAANKGAGGGGNYQSSSLAGGAGGSGVVVVRYTRSQVGG